MIQLMNVEKNSRKIVVTVAVIGEPGHIPDCEYVILATLTREFSPNKPAAAIVAELKTAAAAAYTDGYSTYCLKQQIALLLQQQ